MPFCHKCGTKLADDSVFCYSCGAKVVVFGESSEKTDNVQVSAAPKPVPAMSKEESIAFLEQLASKYNSLERVQKEIKELEQSISSAVNYRPRSVSAFRFFWPFMVYSAIASTICCFLAVLLYQLFGFFIFLAFALPVILTIVGAVRARAIRDQYNIDISNSAYQRRKKKEEDEVRLSSLHSKERSLRKQVEEHNDIVPVNMRSKNKLNMAKRLLEADKVTSFEEAMRL